MYTANLEIPLSARPDRNGQIYHIGGKRFPGYVDCSEGLAALIFLSEKDEEELQLASLDHENAKFSQYIRRPDRLKISLEAKTDKDDRTFYLAKIQLQGFIDFRQGATFIVFTSKPGAEELQIVAPIISTPGRVVEKPENRNFVNEVSGFRGYRSIDVR